MGGASPSPTDAKRTVEKIYSHKIQFEPFDKSKFEVMLNRWRKNYRYRIPIKLNFDFSLSITAGFDNLSIQVGSSNGNVKCFLFEEILLPNAACKQAVQVTYCSEKQRHLNLVRTQRFKRFAELF